MSMEEKITEEETISEKELLALQVLPEYSWDMRNYIMGLSEVWQCSTRELSRQAPTAEALLSGVFPSAVLQI